MLRQLLSLSTYGDVAQLGERGVRNAEAEGSSPFISTNYSEMPSREGIFSFAWLSQRGSNPQGRDVPVARPGRSAARRGAAERCRRQRGEPLHLHHMLRRPYSKGAVFLSIADVDAAAPSQFNISLKGYHPCSPLS